MMTGTFVRGALSAAVLALFATSPASAAVNFAFEASTSNVQVNVGQQALVDIFLVETVSAGDPSILAADNGLYSAGIVVQSEEPVAGEATIASYLLNTSFDGFTAEGTTPGTAPFTLVDIAEAVDQNPGVTGTVSGAVTRIRILTLTINAAPVAGTTGFSLSDNATFEDTYTFGTDGFDGRLLDSIITSGLFTVTTTVPEPVTLAMVALGGFILSRRRVGR